MYREGVGQCFFVIAQLITPARCAYSYQCCVAQFRCRLDKYTIESLFLIVWCVIQEFHYIWTAPFEAITILVLLASLVKVWALPGFLVVFITLGSQYFYGYKVAANKYKCGKLTSERCDAVHMPECGHSSDV